MRDWLPVKKGLLGLVALLIPASAVLLAWRYGQTALLALSVTTTGLLSLALVVLYFQQYQVLDRQTKWMKREYESAISVRRTLRARDDYVYLDIGNSGRGTITAMYLRTELIEPKIEELEHEPGYYQLRTVEGDQTALEGNSLQRTFKGKAKLGIHQDGEVESLPFQFVSNRLRALGIDECVLQLTIEIVDESRYREEPIKVEVAKQELELNEPQKIELPDGDGNTMSREMPQSTTLEEGIPSAYPQDIVPKDGVFDELVRGDSN